MGAVPLRIALSPRGELLTCDPGSGALRFAALASAPANVGVAEDGSVTPTGPSWPRSAPECRCEPTDARHLATLRGLGEDTTVLLAAPHVLTALRELDAGDWLVQSRSTQATTPLPRDAHWPGGFVLARGGLRIDVAASLDLLQDGGEPDARFVIDANARVERLLRYDPVIAYTAFGANFALFRCLEASLYSLARVAGFAGRVVILSDRSRPEIEFLVPGELRPRTRFEQGAAGDLLAMALARYTLPGLAAVRLARPLLYVDTDVIFDRPIGPLLADIVQSQKLCVFAEDELHHPLDFYGGSLVTADPSFTPRHERGFSTGVLGIPDPAAMIEPFRAVAALAEAQTRRTGQRGSTAFDQRFANYLMHKLVEYDDITINRYETYCNGREPDLERRLGLAHFAGGVGNAEPKLARMQTYLSALRAADAPPD